MKHPHISLVLAGLLSFGVAVFQAAISCVPAWGAYFGARGELLSSPALLLAAALLVSSILAIFGLYGLSGAGVIRRLPLLRLGLLGIGLGYTLYGISLVPQLLVLTGFVSAPQPVLMRNVIVFSVLLVAGLLYLTGVAGGWKRLSARVPSGVQVAHST